MSFEQEYPPPPPGYAIVPDGTYQPSSPTNGQKVTFQNVLKIIFKKYARGNGRASRSEYWYFALWQMSIGVVGLVPIFIVIASQPSGSVPSNDLTTAQVLVMGLFLAWLAVQLALLIPSITVTVRRLHDTNKSAHWLWFYLVPYVGSLVIFIMTVLPSDAGPNKYGPQPN